VAPQCSGIEGIALVTLFVTLYLCLFRKDLRFPRALLLYPVGILASAAFNVLRIAGLLIIGLEGSPELAVGGFHSHAGWLMFTLVALGIVALAQTVPALQKAPAAGATGATTPKAPPLPFRQDPIVAAILPFAVFMLSAQLAQAFSQSPSLVYPGRVVLMAGVLALFWPLYARLPWRADPVAVGAGVLIGLAWVLIPVEAGDGPPPYGTLTGVALVGWFLMRGIGTVVLVPIIEELFFRSYLEKRLRLGEGRLWIVIAALIGAALFAALHDRWAEAFVASLIFSWVAWRRGNITDAILSHAAANLVVFSVAWATGQVHII
jgi:exosortase E/protease (VPEID-CTERM system)